ncbi:PhoD-like phosphatase N-terminal domain-containing protein [Streptomyces sp. NPDC094149]|uniref:PhoD-like phosphatase N-terminal domain-containing protein n=1 Tax=Streptomyces sp. NPDC094149 TaxID=3155079 RepID=UPI003316EE31
MSQDENLVLPMAKGTTAIAHPEFNHTVHVEVDGLDPDRVYYYRFRTGTWLGGTGRTRTAAVTAASFVTEAGSPGLKPV